jgi:lysophospholipase L1-like esterase
MTASNNLSQIGAKYTGTILTNGASATNMAYMSTVSCWGDSLTQGTGGQTPYPTQFSGITGYTNVNGGVGGYTSTQILAALVAAPTQWPNLTLIWSGRNDYSTPVTVLANIATMVADIAHDGYMVLSILNSNTEPSGSANYNAIISLNNSLLSVYGSHYLDVRSILVAAYNPLIPQDVIDHSNDVPPSSLRYDSLHLNTAGYALVASSIKNVMSTLRGTRGLPVSTTGVVDLLSAPPQIGVVTPNVGKFTTLTGTTVTASTNLVIAGKSITLSGDSSSLQFPSLVIPSADATYDLGYGLSQFRWRNGYFSAILTCQSLILNGKTFNLSADTTSVQLGASFIPSVDATYDLGYSSSTQRWRNGNFSATVTAATLTAQSGTSSPTYTSNYKTYAVGIGASQDLLSVGSYQTAANGFLAIRCAKAGGVTVSTFAVSMMGGGTPSTYTALSTQAYNSGSATFTITETSAGGVNKITFNNTSGAAVNITVTPMWIYVDAGATVTYL